MVLVLVSWNGKESKHQLVGHTNSLAAGNQLWVIWLVVWLPFFIFPEILGCDYHPLIDELIFFRGVGTPTTNHQPPTINHIPIKIIKNDQ